MNTDLQHAKEENEKMILEIRDNHRVIDDLRSRIEELFEETNNLTRLNIHKNQELLSHIAFLEN